MTQPDDYAAALAAYQDPPGDTTAERDVARFEALLRLRRIARAAALAAGVLLILAAVGVVLVPVIGVP